MASLVLSANAACMLMCMLMMLITYESAGWYHILGLRTRPYRWVQCGEKGATIIEMTAAYKYTKASFDKCVKLDAKKNCKETEM